MAEKYSQWRDADRIAHEAELEIRSLRRRSGYLDVLPEVQLRRAKELRAVADGLFEEAMREMSREVRRALGHRMPGAPRKAWSPTSGYGPPE